MSYKLLPQRMYRMPTHFGPTPGPRQGPDGRRFANVDSPRMRIITVSFLTDRQQLMDLLPDGMGLELAGEPVVTVEAAYMTEIEWLAGRGYNTLGVQFPVAFRGKVDRVTGPVLLVLWENLCDAILSGREELGFSKIYCDLPEPRILQGETHCVASWLGFRFMDLHVRNMAPTTSGEADASGDPSSEEGTVHHKYFPRIGEWGTADVSYLTFTPSLAPDLKVQEAWRGDGTVVFHKATWEDMPTQYNIVNALRDLTVVEYRGAQMITTVGAKDLSDQRIVR